MTSIEDDDDDASASLGGRGGRSSNLSFRFDKNLSKSRDWATPERRFVSKQAWGEGEGGLGTATDGCIRNQRAANFSFGTQATERTGLCVGVRVCVRVWVVAVDLATRQPTADTTTGASQPNQTTKVNTPTTPRFACWILPSALPGHGWKQGNLACCASPALQLQCAQVQDTPTGIAIGSHWRGSAGQRAVEVESRTVVCPVPNHFGALLGVVPSLCDLQ